MPAILEPSLPWPQCIQFRTDQVQDLKRFEKLNKSLSRVLANVPLDAPDPDGT